MKECEFVCKYLDMLGFCDEAEGECLEDMCERYQVCRYCERQKQCDGLTE